GRSGRQGDPGRSKFYISMDDDLMRLFGGERMKVMMTRIGMQPGEPIDHPWLNKGIKKAQEKVEDRNFEIRKHLLDYDDVLNEQRGIIYSQRDEILADENLSTRVMNNAKDLLEDIFYEYNYNAKHNKKDNSALQELNEKIRTTFGLQLPAERLSQEAVEAELQNDITEKEALAGKENFNMFIRYQYITMIDKKWLDQLETLEGLREAVALRSYGSKNPLTEYKIDGFNIFDEMLATIRNSVMSRVFRVRVQLSPEAAEQRRRMLEAQQQGMNAQHSDAGNTAAQMAQNSAERSAHNSFNGDQARRQAVGSAMNQRSQGENVTVRRTIPKVGRNDPCPCGSGKKYKQCCGR
ncbi:MAG: SEC-C domain-containing protein, partial [Treponema sp.]|nr:SEC-C domain-containing protein [Treponema sp.]